SSALRARAWALAHEGGPYRPEVLDLLRLAGDLVADDPDACARARLEEADYLHRRAHHEEALARARAAPARGRLMREQALHVAQNLRGLGRGEESVPVLEALVAADAEDVPGLVAAASLRAASWDYPASHALAERALALEPDCRQALTILGVGLAFRRGEARALEVVARAKALAPDDAHLDCVAGWAHMHQRQTDAAVAAFARAQALTAPRPFHKAIKWRGIVLHRGGRDREALDELDEAIRLRPREADTLMYRGAALFRTGERARALSDWRAAHALDPAFFRRRLNDLPPDLRKAMTDATTGG
ncbi:MAG: hypothetical protein KF878_29975, partial [Planctomycetes bacterium]|nr:hypothetical protein [Planctomycetota bacterium]